MIHMMNIIKHIHNKLITSVYQIIFQRNKKGPYMYIQKKRQVKIPLGFWFSYFPIKQIFINNLHLKHAQ